MVGCGRVSTTTAGAGEQRAAARCAASPACGEAPTRATRQRPEELQRHRQPEPDPVDRRVQRHVHGREHRGQPSTGRHCRRVKDRSRGPAHRQQDHAGHPLADRHHPDRPDHREGQRADRGAGLVATARCRASAPRHGAGPPPGAGADGGAAGRVGVARMAQHAARRQHSQNASRGSSIRWGHGCRAAAAALPRRDRRRRRASPTPRSSSGVSQAAVSRTLAALEHALGVRLLRRTSREVVPPRRACGCWRRARRVLAEVDDLVREATSGHAPAADRPRLGGDGRAHRRVPAPLGRAAPRRRAAAGAHQHRRPAGWPRARATSRWSATGTPDRRRPVRRRRRRPRTAATARWPPTTRWPGAGTLRLADLADRVLPSTPGPAPPRRPVATRAAAPTVEETHDVDDWLAVIATGRCVGVTAESTRPSTGATASSSAAPRRRRRCRCGSIWWRDDPHPATRDVVGLLAELYGRGRAPAVQ